MRALSRQHTNLTLTAFLSTVNPVLRGWTTYFRPGVSSAAFQYLHAFARQRVMKWLGRKYRQVSWSEIRRRYCPNGWWPAENGVALFDPRTVRTTRYRFRGTAIPSPWVSVST